MKKYKLILSLLLILLIAGGVFATLGVIDIQKRGSSAPVDPTGPTGNQATHSSYVDEYVQYDTVKLPLLRSEFPDVFFTMNRNSGAVEFFTVADGVMTPLEETGSFKVTVTVSSQELPAEIHYIERDGHTFGAGLYTNVLYPGAYLYEYAFFKLSDLFGQSGAASGSLLLTVDVNASRMYQNEKVYSENFILSPDKTSAKYYLSEDQRTVDTAARMRTDYKMFTDDILAAEQADGRTVLFFSSRYYEMFDRAGKVDIFTSGGTGTNTDNGREVIDVYTLHFWRREGDVFFFRRADNGFTLNVKYGATGVEETLRTFTGDLEKDYLIDGQYLFNRTTGEMLNVVSQEPGSVNLTRISEKNLTVDLLSVSENGKYLVLRGADSKKKAYCAFMNLESGEMVSYQDSVFEYVAGVNALDDGIILLSMAASKDPTSTSYYQLVAKAK